MRSARFTAGVRLLGLLLGVAAALALAAPAEAATITVNNPVPGTGGTGDCTLQEAIQAANTDAVVDGCTAGSGADTILFCNCTLTLTAPFQVDPTDGPLGLPDITSDITIQGLGAGLSILERNLTGPDFTLLRVVAGGRLSLELLTLRNGQNSSGGGIINRGGMLEIHFSTLQDNKATGALGGGAIANLSPGTTLIEGSFFATNAAQAGPGGAIRNESTLNIMTSAFGGNTAFTIGGAIDTFVGGAPVTIDLTSFFSNTAQSFGGAVHHHQSPLTVTNSSFFSNTAGSAGVVQAGGGAIEGFGPWTISDSMFDGNTTFASSFADGGGLRYIGDSLMVSRATFSNNTAQTRGGGIEINGVASPNIRVVNSTFSRNTANSTGGGGISVSTGSMELNNVTMTLNFGVVGGAILVGSSATSFITRNSILAANDTETINKEDCITQAPAVLTSQGHNLIGVTDGCTIVTMGAGDLLGTAATPLDPQLVPLQDNGGLTMTHALRPGSPAVDAGDLGAPGTGGTTCEAADQRGVGRPVGVACDIGAFEGTLAQADLSLTGMDNPDPVNFGSNVTFTFTVTNNGPNPAPDVMFSHSLGMGFDAVSAMSTQGTCTINQPSSGDEILCDIGAMSSGAMVTVTVVATGIQAGLGVTFAFVNSNMVDDPDFGNNFANLTTLVLRNGDLRLTKFGPTTVQRGTNFDYIFFIENLGGAAATNVTVVDTLPAGVTFVSSTPAVCSAAGSTVTCNLGTLAASPDGLGLISSTGLNLTVAAPATAGVTLTNSATVSATEADPDTSNNTRTFQTDVVGIASLVVTKTDSPDPVPAGSNVTYTITVTNNGPDPATNVALTETTPFGATFVSINPAQGSCTAGPNPLCTIGTINSGASVMVTFVVTADFPCVLDNTVFVTSPDAPAVSASSTTTVGPPAGCVTFTNGGGDGLWTTATNWSGNVVPGPADCVIIPVGLTATLNMGAQVVSSLTVDGTLNINGGTLDTTSAFTVNGTLNVNGPAVAISSAFTNSGAVNVGAGSLKLNGGGTSSGSFAVSPGAIVEFGGGTHTLTATSSVTGTGNGTASFTGATVNVSGSYNIPTNISGGTVNFNSAATAIGMFLTGGTVGGTGTLTITTTLQWGGGSMVGPGTTIDDGFSSIGGDVTLNGRTFFTNNFLCWCGGTISVGNGAVWNVVGTFDIQSDGSMLFNQGGANLQINNSGIFRKTQSGLGTSAVGALFSNTGMVAANAGTMAFTGSFTQTAGSTTLNGGNLGGGITFNFTGGTLGGNGGITGNVINNGASLGPGLSAGTLFVNGNYTQGAAGALNIELGGTAAGQFDVLAITGTATLDGTLNVTSLPGFTPASGDSFQVMTFSSRSGDFFVAKNNLTGSAVPMVTMPGATDYVVSFQVATTADLSVTKTDSPDPVQAGSTLTYSITVSNAGPDPATNVTLADILPAGINFVSATPSQGTCMQASGTVTCNLGSLASSASATVSIDVRPTAAAAGNVSNTASVTATEADPNGANNSSTTTTTVAGPTLIGPTPYLSQNDSPFLAAILSGVVALETFEDGRLDVPGVMTNAGAPLAPGGITDSVDGDDGSINGAGTAGMSFFSGNGAAGITFTFNAAALGGLPTQVGIVWTDGSGTTTFEAFDAAGASLGVIGPVSIADGSFSGTTGEDNFFGVMHAGGISAIRISNTAGGIEVDHLQFGPVPTPVNADLVLTKMDSPDPVGAGSNLTYTLTVMNAGVGAAAGVTVTDTLPAGTAFVSATPSVGMCTGTTTVTCNLGSLATGATETVTIVVTATAGPLNNTASVSVASNELFVFNNAASALTAVTAMADMQLSKADSPDPVAATTNLTYTLTVMNAGPSTATGIVVTDTLPAGVNFVSASAGCAAVGGTVTCNIASLASGASTALSIVVTPQAAVAGTTITNTATVTANEADPNPNNNAAAADTAVVAAMADVQLTKADAPDPVNINGTLTYTLTVRNNGPQSATNVVLTDTLPAGVTFVSATAPCTQAAGTVTCNLGTLSSGAQSVITIMVTPGAALGGTSITNNARVTATEPDPNAANNMASAVTAVSTVPFTLSVPSPATATIPSGAPVTFTFNVTPTAPGIVVAISCGSPLPPATTCSVVPPSIVFNNTNPQPVTVTLQTTICLLRVPPRYGPRFPDGDPRLIWPLLLALSLLFWTKVARRNEQLKRWTPVFALLVFALLLGACANGQGGPAVRRTGPTGTLPGTYAVSVNVTSGTSSQAVTFTLTVN